MFVDYCIESRNSTAELRNHTESVLKITWKNRNWYVIVELFQNPFFLIS